MAFHNYIFDEIFSSITSFGMPTFYILILLILFVFNAPFGLNLLFALLFVELLCIGIKAIYRKERPVPQSREKFFDKMDANSFPSVHSARISLLVTMVCMYYKSTLLSVIGVILIFGVGYSRIYLKRHDYIDVICGFLIGVVAAIIALHI